MTPQVATPVPDDQSEAIAFLGRASTYAADAAVERIETHGALVFLAGSDVFKIKRAVHLPYMDFSTLPLRHAALTRELEINRAQAPDLYLGLVAVIRRSDGSLSLGSEGAGEIIEWALRMRRFPASALLSRVAEANGIDVSLARDIADAVSVAHRAAPPSSAPPAPATQFGRLIAQVADGLEAAGWRPPQGKTEGDPGLSRLRRDCERRLAACQTVLGRRAAAGFVRRCHGDLHLDNIVLWNGKPTLFDALEFDEALATIDTLYDLGFLLMDLDRHGCRPAANVVLNRYLWRSQAMLDIEGLATLPLFMALRAGIRAMVRAQRAAQAADQADGRRWTEVARYLDLASAYLSPPPPRLVAVGGLSGTGKSTLAAALASCIGAAPGALHLRTDLERKAMLAVQETERLAPETYTREASQRVYGIVLEKARAALAAGHAVVVDAAHLRPEEKAQAEGLARDMGIPFTGLWLTAPADLLRSRIMARTGDASDATVEVLEKQLSWRPQASGWRAIDAGLGSDVALSEALALLDPLH
jgi:aminoglycoside phosphotransferase family enzyme/predicted kinase